MEGDPVMIAKRAYDKADHIEWDTKLTGFGLRTRRGKKGVKHTWVVQYKVGSLTRRITADATVVDAARAKAWAKSLLARIELGEDPQGEKKAARASDTFKQIAADFVEHQRNKGRRENTIYATKLHLGRCKPLLDLKLADIGRTQVAGVLKSIGKAHGAVSADRARAALSSCFAWAIGEGLAPEGWNNPVVGTNTQASGDSPGRALDNAELVAIWNASGDDDFGRIVKLLILTGCRRNEIAKLEWEEVKGDVISLPENRTKNGLRFDIPLTDLARETIGPDQPRKFVFGRYSSSEGFGGFSKAKGQLDTKLKGVKPWRLHDLRHTFSTRLHEAPLSVQPHIIEACLNHVSGHKASVAGRYNHAIYNPEKLEALNKWEAHIKVLLAQASGANVTRLADLA